MVVCGKIYDVIMEKHENAAVKRRRTHTDARKKIFQKVCSLKENLYIFVHFKDQGITTFNLNIFFSISGVLVIRTRLEFNERIRENITRTPTSV